MFSGDGVWDVILLSPPAGLLQDPCIIKEIHQDPSIGFKCSMNAFKIGIDFYHFILISCTGGLYISFGRYTRYYTLNEKFIWNTDKDIYHYWCCHIHSMYMWKQEQNCLPMLENLLMIIMTYLMSSLVNMVASYTTSGWISWTMYGVWPIEFLMTLSCFVHYSYILFTEFVQYECKLYCWVK